MENKLPDPRFSKTDKPGHDRYCIQCDGFWSVPMCPLHDHPKYAEETRDGYETLHVNPSDIVNSKPESK